MKVLGWIYFVAYQLASLVLTFVGFVIVAPLAACGAWVQAPSRNPMFAERTVWIWRGGWLTFLWSNDEDGIGGPYGTYLVPSAWAAYYWCAIRNGVNNLRCLPGASFLTDSTVVTHVYGWGYISSQGWRSCLKFHRLRMGWLIAPNAGIGWRAWPVISFN